MKEKYLIVKENLLASILTLVQGMGAHISYPISSVQLVKEEDSLYKAIDKIRDYLELELKKYKLKQRVQSKDKKNSREDKEYKIEI